MSDRPSATVPARVPNQKPSGAPLGNWNGFRHGLRASRLPKHCAFIKRQVNHFRRVLEQAVLDLRGEINVVDGASINSACRWEIHSLLAARWLAQEAERMSHLDRLAYSRDVARASSERDKCIRAIGLDARANSDLWGVIVEGQVVAREATRDARES